MMSRSICMPVLLALLPTLALASGSEDPPNTEAEETTDAESTEEAAPSATEVELRRRLEQTEAMLQLLLDKELEKRAAGTAPAAPAAPTGPPPPPVFDEAAWRALPSTVRYSKGSMAPEHYELGHTVRLAPVITGATMLGVGWLGSTIAAAGDQQVDGVATLAPLYAPVVGPWIALGLDAHYGDLTPFGGWALAFDGVVQDVGFALMVWGLVDKKPIYTKKEFTLATLMVTPSSQGARLALSGSF